MSGAWDERKRALEEDYFRKKEQEAIEKMRAKRAEQQQQEGAQIAEIHCPKCDEGTLVEITHEGVEIDRCNKCGGVWLDEGELEQLTRREDDGWFSRMRRALVSE